MAKFIHNSLAAIFKKIGARENSKEVWMILQSLFQQLSEDDLFYCFVLGPH